MTDIINNDNASPISTASVQPSSTASSHSVKLVLDPSILPTIQPYDNKLSLSELVRKIQSILQPTDNSCIDYIELYRCMISYDYTSNEWYRYAHFNTDYRYTRNLIATDHSTYTLMLLCWNSDSVSKIHDHAESECFMTTLQGSINETQYNIPHINDKQLTVKSDKHSQIGDCCFIDNNIGLHRVANIHAEPAVTLHLYVPPYDSSKCYDENDCSATDGYVTFYSEHGEICEY